MTVFVILVYLLMVVVVVAEGEENMIKPIFLQVADINEDYDVVHSFIYPSSKFTASVAPDYFVKKFSSVQNSGPAVQEKAASIYIEIENPKKISIEPMQVLKTLPIQQYMATKQVYSNLNNKNHANLQNQGGKKQQKQNLLVEPKPKQNKLIQPFVQVPSNQNMIQKQRQSPQFQSIPAAQSVTSVSSVINKQTDESNRVIIITAVSVLILIICLLAAICFNPSQNATLWQKIGNGAHETIVVNEEDEQQINISNEGVLQDNSLNDELN